MLQFGLVPPLGLELVYRGAQPAAVGAVGACLTRAGRWGVGGGELVGRARRRRGRDRRLLRLLRLRLPQEAAQAGA